MIFSDILSRDRDIPTFFYFLLAILGLVLLGGLLLFLLSIRLELFRPIDEPVIFDRENRKVYLIARGVASGWRGLFKPWPIRAYEYDLH